MGVSIVIHKIILGGEIVGGRLSCCWG